jgi:hypothetical protein
MHYPLLASASVTFFSLSILIADDTPAQPTKDADVVAAVRKAAKTSEVHGLGLYGPTNYRLDDVSDWPKLVTAIRTKSGPGGRVWEMLSKDTQKLVADDKNFERLNDPNPRISHVNPIKAPVASDLRKMIDNPDFYTKEAFKGIALTKEMKEAIALGKKRTSLQTAKLNWALLDKAFPGCFPAIPDRFRTARVQVFAGKDVVLVLSSNENCRWEVTLREGAKVTGILLCGYHAQEVAGVDAPTVYRCYYGPDGVTLAYPNGYFYGYDKKKDTFPDFLKSVKNITGKDFTSFECYNRPQPGDESFTIRPSAK